ncbi:MAG: peptidyl-prolyl cis-trans isomerase, partial [Candidatus Omnitrophica bacterium]|nr:peptidyl-prolyl cis-trans isomerase [Candidatus Omnitrophota bacterium]
SYGQEENAGEDMIIAQVGDTVIYFSEIKKVADKLNRFLKENFYSSKKWSLDFVNQYIAQTALAQRAEDEGLDKDEDVRFEMDKVRRGLLSDKILGRELSKIVLTEEDLKDYYDKNTEKYKTEERIKIEYTAFDSKKQADSFVNKLKPGKSLGEIDKKQEAIEIGNWLNNGLPSPGDPVIDKVITAHGPAIFKLNEGETTDIIENEDNFYIIRVTKKEPSTIRPYEEVKTQVIQAAQKETQGNVVNDFVIDTFDKIGVKIYEDNIVARQE